MPIRPVRDDDFATIVAITNHYIASSAIHFGYEAVTADELAAAWRGDDRHPWLVADEGNVIGYAKSGTWRARAAYAWSAEVGLYLAPDARGRGLGRALLEALLAEMTRRGFHSAIAGITLPNPASIALHRRVGFESVGVVREAGFKLDAWHDVAFLQKLLTTA
jgi:phosphinothricin acetyltransferase